MDNLKIRGDALPNMPWEERPAGCNAILWRCSQNPIIERDALSTSNSIFNSAVVPFRKGEYRYAGAFRCDDTNIRMRLHTSFSADGLHWAIDEKDIRLECAAFWCDRVTKNSDGNCSIHNVVGADEYAVGVTDNAFTNGAARRALEAAAKAAKVCGERPDSRWTEIAAGLRIVRFPDGTTREHADYKGEQIKQADANLLGWPLGIVADRESLLRDLTYYENRIDPAHGPAMSHSVFAIQYARLGMTDKALEMFRCCYRPNLRPPFGVFAETAASDNPYFMTGAGGLLQAVLFGFGGLEITDDGLVQRETCLPPGWKKAAVLVDGRQPE